MIAAINLGRASSAYVCASLSPSLGLLVDRVCRRWCPHGLQVCHPRWRRCHLHLLRSGHAPRRRHQVPRAHHARLPVVCFVDNSGLYDDTVVNTTPWDTTVDRDFPMLSPSATMCNSGKRAWSPPHCPPTRSVRWLTLHAPPPTHMMLSAAGCAPSTLWLDRRWKCDWWGRDDLKKLNN